jgi:hypothetical protein
MCEINKLFTFPSEEILKYAKLFSEGVSPNCHYCHSNGDYAVYFSLRYHSLTVDIKKDNEYLDKSWEIHNVTKSTLKTLEERINKYLIKIGAISKLYDVYNYSDYKNLYETLNENGVLDKEHNHFIEVIEHQKAINIEDEKLITHKITANNFYSWYQISSGDDIINVEHLTIKSYIKLIEYMKSLI